MWLLIPRGGGRGSNFLLTVTVQSHGYAGRFHARQAAHPRSGGHHYTGSRSVYSYGCGWGVAHGVVSCWFVPQMRVIVEGELGGEVKLFKPLMFRSQVVRGVHYIIKVCYLMLQTLCLLQPMTPDPL